MPTCLKKPLHMLPHNRPTLGEAEEAAVLRAIRSGWVAQGKEVEEFEHEFCGYLGLPEGHAVALSSGTASLYLALWSLNANQKKIALPVYACSSLRHAIAMARGSEHLIDCAEGSPNLDTSKAICIGSDLMIIPHMFGLPADLGSVKDIPIIEDCAQSLGAQIDGKFTGLHGKVGIFSFSATKLITSGGQGGMLVSTDKSLVEKVRDYRAFDCRRDKSIRFNFMMTDLQAAVGREQLRRLPMLLQRRDKIFRAYRELGVQLLDCKHEHQNPVRYRAVMTTKQPARIIDHLEKRGVKAIVPIEQGELLGESSEFPRAGLLAEQTVSLPVYPSLLDDELKIVITALKEVI